MAEEVDRIKPGPDWEQLNGMGGPDDDSPTPNSMPLVEGGNPAWNDVLQYVPEDKRGEVVPKLQEWDNNYKQVQESLTPWKQFADSGVDPETAQIALNVLQTIETNPEAVYEAIGKSLGITKQEAEELVDEVVEDQKGEQASGISKEQFEALAQQSNAMAQILLAKREEEMLAQQEAELDKELGALKQKYGEFPENEIVYRMLHSDMSAEEALKDYVQFEENLFRRRPTAPRVLSGGGMIPQPKIDPVKLDDKGTRDHVAEMLRAALQQNQ